jgi:hypothetical protein
MLLRDGDSTVIPGAVIRTAKFDDYKLIMVCLSDARYFIMANPDGTVVVRGFGVRPCGRVFRVQELEGKPLMVNGVLNIPA